MPSRNHSFLAPRPFALGRLGIVRTSEQRLNTARAVRLARQEAAAGAPELTIRELQSRATPVGQPAFSAVGTGVESAGPRRRYVDLSGTTKDVERRLKSDVSNTRFRPRFIDGRLARTDQFVTRYYFDF